jgi:hypothetical protein
MGTWIKHLCNPVNPAIEIMRQFIVTCLNCAAKLGKGDGKLGKILVFYSGFRNHGDLGRLF